MGSAGPAVTPHKFGGVISEFDPNSNQKTEPRQT